MTVRPNTSAGSLDPQRAALVRTLQGFLEPSCSHESTVAPTRRGSSRATSATPASIFKIEERSAVSRRFRSLAPRERLVLFRSFVQEVPAAEIASELGISTRYCYKLRNRALDRLTSETLDEQVAS